MKKLYHPDFENPGGAPSQDGAVPGAAPVSGAYPPAGGSGMPSAHLAPRGRKLFALSGRERVFAVVLTALSILSVAIGLFGEMRLGYTICFWLLFAAMTAFLRRGEYRSAPGAFGGCCGVLALLSGGIFTVSGNALVRFAAFFLGAALSVVWFYSISGRRADTGDLGLASSVFSYGVRLPLRYIPRSLISLVSGNGKKDRKGGKILIGFLCAVPVLCIVIPLLSEADAAFEGLVQQFAENTSERVAQVILGLLLTPFLLSFCYSLRHRQPEAPRETRVGRLDGAFTGSFLSVISVIYLIYLFSQLAYFTDAFKGFLPEDFSYAAYARRGFFELCVIAAINLALIFAALIVTEKKGERLPGYITAVCLFIAAFTLLLVCVDIAKMLMYIGEYGMTAPRLCASAFMVFIAVVFGAVLLRMFRPGVRVLHTALLTAAVIVLALGLGNVNRFAADYNYRAYMDGRLPNLDVMDFQTEFGPEGLPYLEKLAINAEARNVRMEAVSALYYAATDYYTCFIPDPDRTSAPDENEMRRCYTFFESSLPILRDYRMFGAYVGDAPMSENDFVLAFEERHPGVLFTEPATQGEA